MFLNKKVNKIQRQNPQKFNKQITLIDQKLESIQNKQVLLQEALYADIDGNQDQGENCGGGGGGGIGGDLVRFGVDREYGVIYGVYGWGFGDIARKIRVSLIRILQRQIQQRQADKQQSRGITLVYFCNHKQTNSKQEPPLTPFQQIRNKVLKTLPSRYLRLIKKILPCHQNFFSKFNPFTSFSKNSFHNQIVDSLVKYCDNLEELVQQLGPLFQCQMIREEVQMVNSGIGWLEIYSTEQKKLAKRKMITQLGQPNSSQTPYKKSLNLYKLNQKGLPIIFACSLKLLKQNKDHIKSQGIFRKACDIQKLKKLQKEIVSCWSINEEWKYQYDWKEEQGQSEEEECKLSQGQRDILKIGRKYDTDTIACFVKSFFCKLVPPIVSYTCYDQLTSMLTTIHHNPQNTNRNTLQPNTPTLPLTTSPYTPILTHLSTNLQKTPTEHKIFLHLLQFFKKEIIPYQKYNKMSLYNLSVVMAPCIFRPKKYQINDLVNSPRFANLLYEAVRNLEMFR